MEALRHLFLTSAIDGNSLHGRSLPGDLHLLSTKEEVEWFPEPLEKRKLIRTCGDLNSSSSSVSQTL